MVTVVYPGSYKQIQTDSPVFIRTTGKAAYIGKKKARTLFNELVVVSCKGDLRIDRKLARCCYGYYEVENDLASA